MAEYKGKTIVIDRQAEDAFDKVSDLGKYSQYIDQLPPEIRDSVGNVRFEPDAIFITAAPVGEVALRVTERRRPDLIRLEAENSPVPLSVSLQLRALDDTSTELTPVISVEVPPMLKPLVGPKMQEVANKLGELLGNLLGRKE